MKKLAGPIVGIIVALGLNFGAQAGDLDVVINNSDTANVENLGLLVLNPNPQVFLVDVDRTLVTTSGTAFSDTYNFTINTDALVNGNVVQQFDVLGLTSVTDLTLELFENNSATLLGSAGGAGSTDAQLVVFNLSATGDYTLVVSGTSTGAVEGRYDLGMAFIAAPIPLPPALVLLGSAIGFLGFVGFRRRERAS